MIVPFPASVDRKKQSHTWVLNAVSLSHEPTFYDLFPLDTDDVWDSPRRIAQEEKADVIAECVPDTWQIRPFHLPRALGKGIQAVQVKPWQYKLIPSAIRELRARGVITTIDIYEKIRAEIREFPSAFYGHIILDLDEVPRPYDLASQRPLYYEYHVVPALPAFEQCFTIARTSMPVFHATDAVIVHNEPVCVLEDTHSPQRFCALPVPFEKIETSLCGCARDSYQRRYV